MSEKKFIVNSDTPKNIPANNPFEDWKLIEELIPTIRHTVMIAIRVLFNDGRKNSDE